MIKANVIVRERDKDTGSISVLDMIGFEITDNPTEMRQALDLALTRFLIEAYDQSSEIFDINIEIDRG